jgi:hypothetical protein
MNKQMTTQDAPKSSQTLASNEIQVGGKHYKKCVIQPWDYVIANDLDYFQGSIIKYVTRWKDKGGVEDLRKALHFLEKYIEVKEKENGITGNTDSTGNYPSSGGWSKELNRPVYWRG